MAVPKKPFHIRKREIKAPRRLHREHIQVFLPRHDLRHRERHKNTVINVLEELRAHGFRDSHDCKLAICNRDAFAERVAVREEITDNIGADHRHALCPPLVAFEKDTPLRGLDAHIVEVVRNRAKNRSSGFFAPVCDISTHKDNGGETRHGFELRNRLEITEGQTVEPCLHLPLPSFGTAPQKHHHAFRAQRRNLPQNHSLHALPHPRHKYHRSHANDDAKHRKERAAGIRCHSFAGRLKDISNQHNKCDKCVNAINAINIYRIFRICRIYALLGEERSAIRNDPFEVPAVLINLAVENMDDALRVFCGFAFVGHEDNRVTLTVEALEDAHHLPPRGGIEITGRLISKDDFRIGDE